MQAQATGNSVTPPQATVSAKTVILEVLSAGKSHRGESMPVRRLVRAASAFNIAENSVRVAIVRLRAEGLVESPERGAYQLGPAAQAVNKQIHGWRSVAERMKSWDGSWVVAFTADLPRTDRPALRKRTQALRLLGFRELKPGLYVRPNNLTDTVGDVRDQLTELGLEPTASVFRADELVEASHEKARELWDVPALEREYESLQATLAASLPKLDTMSPRRSVREAFLLGREGIRQLVLDPLLPPQLIDASKRGVLITTVTQYCDRGLELWGEFLDA